jgi:hypothetical protein
LYLEYENQIVHRSMQSHPDTVMTSCRGEQNGKKT